LVDKEITLTYLTGMKTLAILLASLLLSSHVPAGEYETLAGPKDTVRVGTWNIKRLGNGKKNYELVAKLIESKFDVVAVQEVMTEEGVKEIAKRLPGWSYKVSGQVGRKGYYERYGILVRNSTGKIRSMHVVPDPTDVWTREPAVACVETSNVDFCLVTTHIVFGDNVGQRDKEIASLSGLINNLRSMDTEKDYILVGDFNRPGNTPGFATFSKFGFRLADDGVTNTSLGATEYASAYDHVLLDPKYTREWKGSAERIDMVKELCGGDFKVCASEVSDHAPMVFSLDNRGVDDD
jgi:endonuclease/exonuclease/phosphatase family metal-dependent hydrolase